MLSFDYKLPTNIHPAYKEGLEKYLDIFNQLFDTARTQCEFEFILTLLDVHGVQGAGWDPFENLEKVFYIFRKFKDKGEGGIHFSLFMYGLIIEASKPYEIIVNLLEIIQGGRYRINIFPNNVRNGRHLPQYPIDKIRTIKTLGSQLGHDMSLFDDFFDNRFRNAIFHSDYVVFWPNIRIASGNGAEYAFEDWMKLVNKAIAYFEAFIKVYYAHIADYKETKIIKPHPDFSQDTDLEMNVIVREKHGVVGLRDNWTPEQVQQGRIPVFVGRILPYESRLIHHDRLLELPLNRIEKYNNILKMLPRFIRRYFVKYFKSKTQ